MINRKMYLDKLISLMHNGRAKIITGIRRCGKSYLLKEIFKAYLVDRGVDNDHIIYIALDDDINSSLLDPRALSQYLRSLIKDDRMHYFILDEIQRVYRIVNPILTDGKLVLAKDEDKVTISFIDVINGLIQIKNADVYITGSNSRFLSKDIMTEFRDRGDEIHMQSLSFKEIVESGIPISLDDAFKSYMVYGGMPMVQSYKSDEEKKSYLNNLFDMTYTKDIEERNHIRNNLELETLIKIMASNVGSLTNAATIQNTFNSRLHLKLSDNTIGTYLKYLEDSYIIKRVNRYDIKGRKHIGAQYKYYFADPGLRNSRLDFLHGDDGHVMENIIYNELIRRGYSVEIGVVEIFGKDKNGKTIRNTLETDFIASIGGKIYYIQSAYEMNTEEKRIHEKRPLININNSFKKIIITYSGGPIRRDLDGITYMDVKQFLLNENSLDL